jgi:hypothetical protein
MSNCATDRWTCKPGSWDALKTEIRFASDNEWGIPCLPRASLADTPAWLAPYRTRIRTQAALAGAAHFFLADYRFESVWNHPKKALRSLRAFPLVLTPDFSLYRDWPLTLQLYNTYRNRWCGAYWQSEGLTVIPTLSWSSPESYEFCFCGVARHSLVAISAVGVALDVPAEYHAFMAGFREMVGRLSPSRVLSYGPLPAEAHALVDIVTYPTRWQGIAAARKTGYKGAAPPTPRPARQPTQPGEVWHGW